MFSGSSGLGSGLVLIPGLRLRVLLSFSISLKFVNEWNQKWFMVVKGPSGALFMWVRD